MGGGREEVIVARLPTTGGSDKLGSYVIAYGFCPSCGAPIGADRCAIGGHGPLLYGNLARGGIDGYCIGDRGGTVIVVYW